MLMVEQSIYPPSDNKPLMWLSQLVANTMENTLKTLPGYVVYELLPSRGKNQKNQHDLPIYQNHGISYYKQNSMKM